MCWVLTARVPPYIGDPKRDPNVERYPYVVSFKNVKGARLPGLESQISLRVRVLGSCFAELECVKF